MVKNSFVVDVTFKVKSIQQTSYSNFSYMFSIVQSLDFFIQVYNYRPQIFATE